MMWLKALLNWLKKTFLKFLPGQSGHRESDAGEIQTTTRTKHASGDFKPAKKLTLAPMENRLINFVQFQKWIKEDQPRFFKENQHLLAQFKTATDPKNGRTLLHEAALSGNLYIIRRLLEAGFAVDAVDSNGKTAFQLTLGQLDQSNYEEAAVLLVEANCNCQPLLKKRNLLKYLYENNLTLLANIFQKKRLIDVNAHVSSCYAQIHICAKRGNSRFLEFINAIGGDINIKDGNGLAAIHHATMNNHNGFIQTLARLGANLNIQDSQRSRSALHYAAIKDSAPICRTLLAQPSIDVSLADDNGMTALRYMLYGAQSTPSRLSTDLCEEAVTLIQRGGLRQPLKGVPLDELIEEAIGIQAASLVLAISAADLDLTTLSFPGEQTLLHFLLNRRPTDVRSEKNNLIATLLQQQKFDVNAQDSSGNTPLHCARNVEDVKALIALGAQLEISNAQELTPLFRAAQQGLTKICEYLITHGANPYKVREKDQFNIIHFAKYDYKEHSPTSRAIKKLIQLPLNVSMKLSNSFDALIKKAKALAKGKKILLLLGEFHGEYRIFQAEKILIKIAKAYGIEHFCCEHAKDTPFHKVTNMIISWVARHNIMQTHGIDNHRARDDFGGFNLSTHGLQFRDFGMSEDINAIDESAVAIVGAAHLIGLVEKSSTRVDLSKYFVIPMNFTPMANSEFPTHIRAPYDDPSKFIQVNPDEVNETQALQVLKRWNH